MSLEPMEKRCPSCPFRPRGKIEFQPLLVQRALSEATPICHSTGDSDVVPMKKKICKEDRACRGARDLQLRFFTSIGFLPEPTDAAWKAKCEEMGL